MLEDYGGFLRSWSTSRGDAWDCREDRRISVTGSAGFVTVWQVSTGHGVTGVSYVFVSGGPGGSRVDYRVNRLKGGEQMDIVC